LLISLLLYCDKGALIKLDISNNRIGAEQERGLQRICVAGGIELAIDKVPASEKEITIEDDDDDDERWR
jgi:hypothetical protein